MTDIVERLRTIPRSGAPIGHTWNLCDDAADEIEKLRKTLKRARRDALKEAWLVVANKSVPETPATFEEILERDIEITNEIRALGEKE